MTQFLGASSEALAKALIVAGSYKSILGSLAPLAIFLWFVVPYYTSPLRRYPGPFLAGWTNLWRLQLAISADYAPRIKQLHDKYGPVVRIGPNLLDLDYPELARTIYGTDGRWKKTDFYKNNSAFVDGKLTYHMFSEVDSVPHAQLKRPVVHHFSMPRVLEMEPLMDDTIAELCDHLDKRFAQTGVACDLSDWLVFHAWDFLGVMTFSRRFGYMDAGRDFDGTIAIGDKSIDYLAICGQMPWLDHLLDKNPLLRLGPPNLAHITRLATSKLRARLAGTDKPDPSHPDLLQHFITAKSTHPSLVDDRTVISYLLSTLIAGADTTAIALQALFHHTLLTPRIYARLTSEIRTAAPRDAPCPNSTARTLPYLQAVIRETIRFHPPISMCMERAVPAPGLVLPSGETVPAGAHVGMNPYVVGRNRAVFGEDADEFVPERWLRRDGEGEAAYGKRVAEGAGAILAFGGGSRVCIGRKVSQMEMYKVVATILARFDVELDDGKAWGTSSRWFYRTRGLVVRIKRRGV